MSDVSLKSLEDAQNCANEKYLNAQSAAESAKQQAETAKKEYMQAAAKAANGEISKEEWKNAIDTMNEAKAAEKAANETVEQAACEAQNAADAVDDKKQQLREKRADDKTYVVHCARIECPFGMRESYLALDKTHGVFSHQIPQMTVKDIVLDKNIINFGGCYSKENPSVQEEIKKANAIIESKKDFRDDIVSFFQKGVNFAKSLFGKNTQTEEQEEKEDAQFVGECKAKFAAQEEWIEGHEKVFINGEPVLLRRCSITCIYGGCITILDSGQPE